MHRIQIVLLTFFAGVSTFGQDLERLPVKRVVLYKNGVGYFQNTRPIRGNQDVTISFTSGQLNDVLKSLTVLDLNGGRISGVGYGSSAPMDRELGDLRLPVGEKSSLTDILGALRGAKLEVRSGTNVISGRLLSVERKTRMGGGATLEVDYLSLVTDSGEVKTTELSPSFSVKLLERGLAIKVDKFLDLVSAGREADVRKMVISTQGDGGRSLFVSYISEVPVWKATYRIVLDRKREPLVQGWAIVDNTVGQDWENVELSLVAGAPQSFIQNLSQPYYTRRPVVALPQAAMVSPQTYEATLISGSGRVAGTVLDASGAVVPGVRVRAFDSNGMVVGDATSDRSGRYEIGLTGSGPVRLEVEATGFQRMNVAGVMPGASQQDLHLRLGSSAETVTVEASAATVNTMQAAVNGRSLGSGAALGGAARKMTPVTGSGGGVWRRVLRCGRSQGPVGRGGDGAGARGLVRVQIERTDHDSEEPVRAGAD